MDDILSYPTDAMNTTASTVQNEIDNALPTHYQIINAITNLEGLFPGNVEETFLSHVKAWRQNVEVTYASLNNLADHLSQASREMAEVDHDFSQEFAPQ